MKYLNAWKSSYCWRVGGLSLLCLLVAGSTLGQQIISDDFNQTSLDLGRWQAENPFGDATLKTVGAGSGDAHLQITVPGNQDHDSWNAKESVRLLQTVEDQDFSVDVKYDSLPAHDYQTQGFWVEDTEGNGIRACIQFLNGTLRLWVGKNIGTASPTQIASVNFSDVAPPTQGYTGTIYERLTRTGTSWSVFISADGVHWVDLDDFELEAVIAQVGLEAGNSRASGDEPDWVMSVDYFFKTDAPITPEDAEFNVELKLNTVTRDAAGNIVISWVGNGVLEEAPAVTGSWTASVNQANPQSIPPLGPAKFYRVKQQ